MSVIQNEDKNTPQLIYMKASWFALRCLLIAARTANPQAARANEDGSGTVDPPVGWPNR
jgi:hypothetical protein